MQRAVVRLPWTGFSLERRRLFATIAAAVLASTLAVPALADKWPTRPVHLVVPFPPGGSTDVVSRIVADRLSQMWGEQVVVDNKPGAGTNLAAEMVARSEPDGYTIFMGTTSLTTSRFVYRELHYELSDLAPVSLVCTFPLLVMAPPNSPVKTIAELVAFARERKDKVTFASPGVGTIPHLAGELLNQLANIEMTHVPYRGDAPALTDTIAGRVDFWFGGSAMIEYVRGGQLRGIAITTAAPSPIVPELPTVAETVPGYDVSAWFALFAPARTPHAIVAKITGDTAKVVRMPEVEARFKQIGVVGVGSTPEALGALVAKDLAKWGKVIKERHVVMEQ